MTTGLDLRSSAQLVTTMITPAETHQTPVKLVLPERVFQGFQKAKDFLTEKANTLTESAQQANRSLTQTAGQTVNTLTEAADKAVDNAAAIAQAKLTTTAQQAKGSLGETIEQTKDSLEQTLQTASQLKSTTSEAIQTAISSSISDWLQAHPIALRLVHLLLWATNHPILSLVLLLFSVAIAWSLIRAIGRLIDTVGWSLLQAPFKLSQLLIGVGFKPLHKFGGLAVKRLVGVKNAEPPALQNFSSEPLQNDKQQRLAEISTRLEAISQEQNELLQEVAAILTSDK